MLKIIVVVTLMLFGAVAYGDDQVATTPRDQQVEMAKARASTALNELVVAAQKAGITTAPIMVQTASSNNGWNNVRDWLRTVLVPAAISVGLCLMRIHTKIMQQAAMNGQVTTSAYGFGALFAQHVLANGGSAVDLNVRNKDLATYVDLLLANYPDYAKKLGLTEEKAAVLVLKGAASTVTTGAALPLKADKSPEQIAYEAAGNTNWDAQPEGIKQAWERFAVTVNPVPPKAIDIASTPPAPSAPPTPPVNSPTHPGIS